MSTVTTIDYSQEEQELQAEYQAELAAMDTMDASTALIYCMTVLLPTVSEWYELQMMELSQVLDELTAMQSDLNTIQSAFNMGDQYAQEMIDSGGSFDLEGYEKYTQEAMDAADDIREIINSDPAFASIADDVNNQLDTIFGTETDSWGDAESVATYWGSIWVRASGQDEYDVELATDQMQPINDAFDALATDFSNVSSSTQSELQYYQSCDQQMQGLIDDMQDEWASQNMAIINNQIAR